MVFGTLLVILTPAFTGYDEPYHYVRAWQLSNGQVHSVQHRDPNGQADLGAYFPATLYVTMSDALLDGFYEAPDLMPRCTAACASTTWQRLRPMVRARSSGSRSVAVYPPIPYIPSAAAIAPPGHLGSRPSPTLWLARFATLVAYVLIVAFAMVPDPTMARRTRDGRTHASVHFPSRDGVRRRAHDRVRTTFDRACDVLRCHTGAFCAPSIIEVGLLTAALGLSKPPYILFLLLLIPAIVRHRHALLAAYSQS